MTTWNNNAEETTTLITWELAPGTTVCEQCSDLIASPDNTLPGEWLAKHQGHLIKMMVSFDPPRSKS